MNCPRCGHPHTQEEWDQLWTDWHIFFQRSKGLDARKAFDAAHREMRKHGPRPKGPDKLPTRVRIGGWLLGGSEMVKWLTWLWNFFNGKKTLIASILVGIPLIWDAIAPILGAAGMPESTIVYVGGLILLLVGWAHKILKAIGVASSPEELRKK